jgi:hypothetical protein
MRSLTRVLAFICLFALLSMAGCQKVKMEKDFKISPGDAKAPFIVSAPNREQDVTVTVTSTSPVDVYIASEKDITEGTEKIAPPKNSYASKKGIEKDTVTAKVPAKMEYGVLFLNPKKKDTDVTAKLNAK